MRRIPSLRFSVSATTRPARPAEQQGRDYYFLTKEEFETRVQAGQLYEWQEVYAGVYYGTLREEVERIWAEGHQVVFDVDVVGAVNLKKELGERALTIFVSVENVEVLRERLTRRQTETEESLQKRLAKASEEMAFAPRFDYVLINNELERAVAEAETVVKSFLER